MGKLSIARAKALSRPGFYHDSPTLYLSVSPTGSRSWIQRITIEGRRHDLGLGGFPLITPEHARRRAAASRLAVADGKNPLTDKRKVRIPTFRQAALIIFCMIGGIMWLVVTLLASSADQGM